MEDQQGRAPAERRKKQVNWELDRHDIQIECEIGHGSTSQVYRARLRTVDEHGQVGERVIAVKEIGEVEESTLLAVRRELSVMTRIDHPHILRFIGVVSRDPPLNLCLEYCDGGTLFDLLHNQWDIEISWLQRMKMLVDIASAMEYLHNHRKQIIHRDLKSLNIFLLEKVEDTTTQPNLKLADFGFARIRNDIQAAKSKDWPSLTRGAGSMHWMAPEVYEGTHYHEKADVFSFSIVTYEVVCRHMAFEEYDAEEAGRLISSGNRPDLTLGEFVPADTPLQLYELMQRCWNHDPNLRPSFTEIHQDILAIQAQVHAGAYQTVA